MADRRRNAVCHYNQRTVDPSNQTVRSDKENSMLFKSNSIIIRHITIIVQNLPVNCIVYIEKSYSPV